jgi:putative SOS response-associated peptidase YedK
MIPSFSGIKNLIPFARAEGDHNKNDDPDYNGSKGIILKKEFRKQIRSQRCIAIVSAFIVQADNKYYLVHLKNRPFALAGIFDNWKEPNKEEIIHSFALVTVPANEILRSININRMPVILEDYYASKWVNEKTALTTVTSLLNQYPSELMNAYPISNDISKPENNFKDLLKPIGDHLNPELLHPKIIKLPARSWGHKKKSAPEENKPDWGERNGIK